MTTTQNKIQNVSCISVQAGALEYWSDGVLGNGLGPALHNSRAPSLRFSCIGGEGGIRTPVPDFSGKRFSRPPRETTLPPLRAEWSNGVMVYWINRRSPNATAAPVNCIRSLIGCFQISRSGSHLSQHPIAPPLHHSILLLAGREGLEPPTDGFGDRYSTN